MSEQTGATERIEISGTLELVGDVMYLITDCNKCQGCGMEHPSYQCSSCRGTGIETFRIVPADAVVIDRATAETAAADVRAVLNQAYVGWESDVVRDRLDAALAAGGE